MNFLILLKVELKKLRRSHIIWILLIPLIILWIPNILNSGMVMDGNAMGIAPENDFFIQAFLGLAWFMYPATLVIGTVLLCQTERNNHGLLKMLSLPVSSVQLCLAKFMVLLLLAAVQLVLMDLMYFPCAIIASEMNHYQLLLSPSLVFQQTGLLFLSSLPMAALYWMVAVLFTTPVFSIGIGLASIVPSVLIMNTDLWYCYPPCYPFFLLTVLQGEMSRSSDTFLWEWVPFLPVAAALFAVFLTLSCICFDRAERR